MKFTALLGLSLLGLCNTAWGDVPVFSELIVAPAEAVNPVSKSTSRSCGQMVNQAWVSVECQELSKEEEAEIKGRYISDKEILESGGTSITRVYLVLNEMHHGIFLLPDTQDLSIRSISIVFGHDATSQKFSNAYYDLLQRGHKAVYCECTGLYYEKSARNTLKVKQARLFLRYVEGH